MAKDGKMSCSSKSRHVNIKYFWVTDSIQDENMEVEHCPTDLMVAEYFTKPLQGTKFNIFCRIIMDWDHTSTLDIHNYLRNVSSIKERVGNTDNMTKNHIKNNGNAKNNIDNKANGRAKNDTSNAIGKTGKTIEITRHKPTWADVVNKT